MSVDKNINYNFEPNSTYMCEQKDTIYVFNFNENDRVVEGYCIFKRNASILVFYTDMSFYYKDYSVRLHKGDIITKITKKYYALLNKAIKRGNDEVVENILNEIKQNR